MKKIIRQGWLAAAVLVTMCLVIVLPSFAADSWYKLSGTMQSYGDVTSFEISPDGKYVVYEADAALDEVFDLYSVPIGGGTPVRLSSLIYSTEGDVYNEIYRISPDSSRVLFTNDQDSAGQVELFSVPIMGPASAVVKLNKTLPEDGNLWTFSISPDSKTVVYSADQDVDLRNEIYAVPLAGPASAGIKLNDTVVDGGSLYSFLISPDSKTVVYNGDQDTYEVEELYSVPISGAAAPTKLNPALVNNGAVGGYNIDPSATYVVYEADQVTYNKINLYTVPIGGPAASGVQISPASVGQGVWSFEISADGKRVVYRSYQDVYSTLELYSVPILGPAASVVKLNTPLPEDHSVLQYRLSADSKRVVYKADPAALYDFELFSVPIAGPAGASIKLNKTLAAGGSLYRFAISPNSARVVYTADLQGSPTNELYSVPLTGPASSGVKLNGPLTSGGSAWFFDISPNSSQVAYMADANTVDVNEVFVVPIAGPASSAETVSGPMASGGDGASDFWFAPNSQTIAYSAEQQSANNNELYASGSAPPEYTDFNYLPITVKE